MMKIGFIGLGAMGRPMAFNLLAAGFEVFAFDLSEAAVKETEAKVPGAVRQPGNWLLRRRQSSAHCPTLKS